MSEINNILERYNRRKENKTVIKNSKYFYFNYFARVEREQKYLETIEKLFPDKKTIKVLEIGAGYGVNLFFFLQSGIPKKNIYANELIEERFEALNENFTGCNLLLGDASELNFYEEFDIVMQSTVFTSVLDTNFRKKLAAKMFNMTKRNGIILWYDFIYNNPKNPDVKGITKREVIKLFPDAKKIKFFNVTLAPPIGRRVGRFYPIINFLFPFLRTHIIAVIYK